MRGGVLFKVGGGIEGGLTVSCAGQSARQVSGFGPPAPVLFIEEGFDQPQIGPPGFHRGAEIVHRDGLDAIPVLDCRPGAGKNVPGDAAERRADGFLRSKAGSVAHVSALLQICDRFAKVAGLRPFHSGSCLLHKPRRVPKGLGPNFRGVEQPGSSSGS